ncbi:MAG: thioredoxin [Pedosphaera sp.]|nr:thioredoxin [Pedosphaera sp.]
MADMDTNRNLLERKHYLTVADDNFAAEVLNSELPVLVDFWAEWCGPCRMIGPVVESLAEQYAGKVKVVKLNVDENQKVCADFSIRSIPTLLVFKQGVVVERVVGAVSRTVLMEKLNVHL